MAAVRPWTDCRHHDVIAAQRSRDADYHGNPSEAIVVGVSSILTDEWLNPNSGRLLHVKRADHALGIVVLMLQRRT